MIETEPIDHGLPGHGWTVTKLRRWVKQVLRCEVSRSLLHKLLAEQQLSWKKCQKLLKKADPAKRQAFIEEFGQRFEQLWREQIRLVYVDEAHFHRDLDLGYTWAPVGQPVWRASSSPGLAERINWYGGYDFGRGRCFLWQGGGCDGETTLQFLQQLAAWLGDSPLPVVLIWDGAPWHRDQRVRALATKLGFILMPLPGYSPDLNPIEGLWKWMREEVTQHHCHASLRALFDACQAFIARINADPEQIITRLWPKCELDPDFEKLLVS